MLCLSTRCPRSSQCCTCSRAARYETWIRLILVFEDTVQGCTASSTSQKAGRQRHIEQLRFLC